MDLSAHLLKVSAWAGSWPSFEWFESPPERALKKANDDLVRIGALDERGQLTWLGKQLAVMPIHPHRGLALLWGARLDCLDEVAFMCALSELPRDPLFSSVSPLLSLDPWCRWDLASGHSAPSCPITPLSRGGSTG